MLSFETIKLLQSMFILQYTPNEKHIIKCLESDLKKEGWRTNRTVEFNLFPCFTSCQYKLRQSVAFTLAHAHVVVVFIFCFISCSLGRKTSERMRAMNGEAMWTDV